MRNKLFILCGFFSLWALFVHGQMLATFEEDHTDHLSLSDEWYDSTLFVSHPGIYPNPDTTGINSSAKCFGATNVADADWWGNFVCLNLDTSIVISASNRFLSFMMYRTLQPKEVRVGFNGREEWEAVFYGKAAENSTWEKVTVDLFSGYEGQVLNQLWIIFSCNWSDPRTGWDEASYYFDNFELTGSSTVSLSVAIDPGKSFQEIDGFGASDCWTGNFIGQWSDNTRRYVAEKLFSQEFDDQGNPEGIGLSMWRFNLGAGTYEQGDASGIEDFSRRAECFLDESGNYDWAKQSGQQYFLNQANSYGCEHFVAFSNSPLTIYTKNGKGFADPGGICNLADDRYDDFAEYTGTVLKHFADEGIDFSYFSPVNEPQYDWTGGQEGSPWENSDIKKLSEQLDASLQARGLSTKILLAEAGSWQYLYRYTGRASNQIFELFNSGSENYVGDLPSVAQIIGGHSYWTHGTNQELKDVRINVRNYSEFQFLKSYQTEWSLLGDPPDISTGFPASYDMASTMDIALFMAKVIQADLTFASVSSWSFWTAMDVERWGHKNRFLLVKVTPSDGPYGSILNSGTAEDTPTLWALGNFSLFIRPGYTRIDMEGADDMNGLFGSAYIAPDTGRLVAVYVNTGYSGIQLSTTLENLDYPVQSVRNYVTSSGSSLERDLSLPGNQPGEIIHIPARSVSTVVYELNNGTTDIKDPPKEIPEITLYPNPVSHGSTLNIELTDQSFSGHLDVTLLTVDGRVMYHDRVNQIRGKVELTLPEEISRGTYLLRIKDYNRSNSIKILIQ